MLVAAAAAVEDFVHFLLSAQSAHLLLQKFHCCSPATDGQMVQNIDWSNKKKKKTFVIGGAAANDEVAKQEQFKQFKKMLLLHSLKV